MIYGSLLNVPYLFLRYSIMEVHVYSTEADCLTQCSDVAHKLIFREVSVVGMEVSDVLQKHFCPGMYRLMLDLFGGVHK